MTIKEQLIKIKENWLIVLILLAVVFIFYSIIFVGLGSNYSSSLGSKSLNAISYSQNERDGFSSNSQFAPEEKSRKITKNTHLLIDIKFGKFSDNKWL